MKYLISGSTGFIGSRLCKRLSGQWAPITREALYKPEELRALFKKEKPEFIFHLASYGNHSNQTDKAETLLANIFPAFFIFEQTDSKVFNFSTSSVDLPTQTMYSISKRMGEDLSALYPNITNIRPYSIFGEGEADFRFIPTVCRALILNEELTLDPSPIHDWVYVENFIDILLDNLDTNDKVLEIGSGIGITNREVVEMLSDVSGKTCKVKQVGPMRSYDNEEWMCPTPSRMNVSLSEALLNTYKYYEHKFKN